jgi:upstream activation factor subunit UAF30
MTSMATEKKASPKKAAAPKVEVAAAEPVKKKAAVKQVAAPVVAPVVAPAAPAAPVVAAVVAAEPAKKSRKTAAVAPAPVVEEGKRAPNAAFMKPLTPSAELAAVVGKKALPRTEAVKKIWDYIKKHDLQDPANRRNINADKKLKAVFGKDQVTMFEMTKLMSAHLK